MRLVKLATTREEITKALAHAGLGALPASPRSLGPLAKALMITHGEVAGAMVCHLALSADGGLPS